jgi:hypothetical protein
MSSFALSRRSIETELLLGHQGVSQRYNELQIITRMGLFVTTP